MPTTCSKCDLPHYARGLCRHHYLEAVRSGEIVVGERGRRIGTSTLSAVVQHSIAEALVAGDSISAIARARGVSRDQVRTVRSYLERFNV